MTRICSVSVVIALTMPAVFAQEDDAVWDTAVGGGNLEGIERVSNTLHDAWSDDDARVHNIKEYYTERRVAEPQGIDR